MSAKTLGAHFLSQDALCTTWKNETLDACIKSRHFLSRFEYAKIA